MSKRRAITPPSRGSVRSSRSAESDGEDSASRTLLPPGLADGLPPDAAFEVATIERLIATLAGHGYERVKPPLIEFEDSLLAGSGAAMAADTFRLMDPISQKMLALRSDMTLQIGRIAAVRLSGMPRPLRLSYSGQVLRVRGSSLRPARQFGQVGAELIGSDSPAADGEAIRVATDALKAVGVAGISVDLGLPTLVPAIARGLALDAETVKPLRAALDRKDATQVAAMSQRLGRDAAKIFAGLLGAAGPLDRALERLGALTLTKPARDEYAALVRVAKAVRAAAPDLDITVDPVENRGFEYHTGVTTAFFARGVRGELGRGGRYRVGVDATSTEPATGFTLFMDTVLAGVPRPKAPNRLFVPHGTPDAEARRFRAEGWIVLAGLDPAPNADAEARRLGCTHVLKGGSARPLA